jgi:mannose-6-phosphate isomerase
VLIWSNADANHKPEMVIALTRFEALYGFRPITELSELLTCLHPFQDLVGSEATYEVRLAKERAEAGDEDQELTREAIRQAFKAILQANSEKVEASTRHLVRIANECVVNGAETSGFRSPKLAQAITQLSAQYPDDIGLIIMLFMNHVELEAGEAMFVQPGELHAYLSGGTPNLLHNTLYNTGLPFCCHRPTADM